MIPMLPVCSPQARLMPMNPVMAGCPPPMVPACPPPMVSGCPPPMVPGCPPPMVPMMPVSGAPLLCPQNMLSMISTTSIVSEYDSQLYGRFHHVEREHPRYRHAPFDWYRPPKQAHMVVHEDAAVVTLDGPVPIGDFYRHYIYGDDDDDYYDDDDYDEYDEDDSASYASDEYGDTVVPSYEPRSVGYRRYPPRNPGLDNDVDIGRPANPSPMSARNYTTLNRNRRAATRPSAPQTSAYRRNRSLAGDDNLDDAASLNSTYAN